MNALMPDAPQGAAEASQPAMQGMGAPQAPGNALMPPQPAQGAPAPQPTKEEIAQSRKHVATIMDGLISLTSKPRGDLTKDDVFKEASDMIAKGAFPNPEARQQLVVMLAQLPDDEPALRKQLGSFLLAVSQGRQQLHGMFGAGED